MPKSGHVVLKGAQYGRLNEFADKGEGVQKKPRSLRTFLRKLPMSDTKILVREYPLSTYACFSRFLTSPPIVRFSCNLSVLSYTKIGYFFDTPLPLSAYVLYGWSLTGTNRPWFEWSWNLICYLLFKCLRRSITLVHFMSCSSNIYQNVKKSNLSNPILIRSSRHARKKMWTGESIWLGKAAHRKGPSPPPRACGSRSGNSSLSWIRRNI